MSPLTKNINAILKKIDSIKKSKNINRPIQVLVASKYASIEDLRTLSKSGITLFGENKLQSFLEKKDAVDNAHWHMIGHLQKNKVKKAVAHFECIQSIDSLALLEKINICAKESNKKISGLIQVNIAKDEKKHGFSASEVERNKEKLFSFSNVKIRGIMTIVPYLEDKKKLRIYFKNMKALFELLKQDNCEIDTLSMGMSHDFDIAIEEGATLLRLGRIIFKGA